MGPNFVHNWLNDLIYHEFVLSLLPYKEGCGASLTPICCVENAWNHLRLASMVMT